MILIVEVFKKEFDGSLSTRSKLTSSLRRRMKGNDHLDLQYDNSFEFLKIIH